MNCKTRREYHADSIRFDFANQEPSLPVARIIWACIGIVATMWIAIAVRW